MIALLWAGANGLALWGIDHYDSWRLGRDFGVAPHVIRRYEFRTIDVKLNDAARPLALWYRYRPPAWGSARSRVPLIVFLHGAGERGADNVQQLKSLPSTLCNEKMVCSYPCALLAPQCPAGMQWTSRLETNLDVLDCVEQMIDAVLADARIDRDRVYLMGFSMGGFGSWELATRAPKRFAAVVPVCGGGDVSRADRLTSIPICAVHGADDKVVPVAQSQSMVAAIERAGGRPLYLEMSGVGHNCWKSVFGPDESNVLMWIFQQARRSSPTH